MSAPEEDVYGDILSASPSVLAETALRRIHELAAAGATPEEVHEVAATSVALLNMKQQANSRRSRKHRWLAKVTSFAFPRSFAVGKPPMAKDYPDLDAHLRAAAVYAAKEHHMCFTVEITDGGKAAVGRQVEVQVPDEDAERFAHQILRLIEWRNRTHPGPKEDQVT